MNDADRRFRQGLLVGLIAYGWWGLVPIFFRQIRHIEPLQILSHRIVWSVLLLSIIIMIVGGSRDVLNVLKTRRTVLLLGVSALLLAVNWLLYIYATVNNRVTEASLGYYMMPLVNAFFATVFLGEKLRPAHYPALGLVVVGVAIPMAVLGSGWLSLALPISFGFYGLMRKKMAVESLTGLCVESLLLFPFCLGYLSWAAQQGTLAFASGTTNTTTDVLLVCSGIITVVPLLSFTYSIRRLPLLTVTFVQFLSPSMQFLVALIWNEESPPWPMWTAIGCVLVAVLVFMADAVWALRTPSKGIKASDRHKSTGASPTIKDAEASLTELA